MHNFPFAFSMMQLIDTLSQQTCMIIKRYQSWVYAEKSCFLIPFSAIMSLQKIHFGSIEKNLLSGYSFFVI